MNTIAQQQHRKWILAAVIIGSGMAFLDGTVVNIAIPTIQSKFNASLGQIQWMINAFALMLASLILVCGSAGDRFGRKRVFNIGLVFFTLASLLASFAQTATQLIIYRGLQGLGAAMMIPGSLAIINSSFPEQTRGKAIGLWSGFSGGVAALGPLLGGWLVQNFGWPAIFLINLPLGVIALILSLKYIPESRNPDAKRLDWLSTAVITLSLFGISFGLIQNSSWGWTDYRILLSLVGSGSLLPVFYWMQKRTRDPLVPLSIFKSNLILGANLITLLLYFALNGLIFFTVLNFQQIQHYSPLLAGMALLPPILLITFLSGPAGGLSDKIGPRKQMIFGPLLVAVGMAWLAFAERNANYWLEFLPGMILFGLGMASVIAPLTKSALSPSGNLSGVTSGVNNAVSRVAALLAVAIMGALALSIFTQQLTVNIERENISNSAKQQVLAQSDRLADIQAPDDLNSQDKMLVQTAVEKSFTNAYRVVMITNAILALLSALLAVIFIRHPQRAV